MSEYSNPSWPFSGGTHVPPPALIPHSTRNGSPHPWDNYNPNGPNYTFANDLGPVGPQPLPHGSGYEVDATPYRRGSLCGILKKFLSYLLTHPDPEIIAFHTESSGHGKTRVTVTFETSSEM